MRTTISRLLVVSLAGALVAGCENAGDDRVLALEATGSVKGVAFIDVNGSLVFEGPDVPLPGIGVGLVTLGTRDTVGLASSDAAGLFVMARVPVGSYVVVVDTTTVGDSVEVAHIGNANVTVIPDDSVSVTIAVSFPKVSVAEARALPTGMRVVAEGVALIGSQTFSDTTIHLADTSGAIRVTRVTSTPILPGDSVRLVGTTSTRDGQPTLDKPTGFVLDVANLPVPERITTAMAATADGGRLDAALVRVADATIGDTATVGQDFRLTVADASGQLEVLLDSQVGFTRAQLVPGAVIDATGVVVPDGMGRWRLKPRADTDLVVK